MKNTIRSFFTAGLFVVLFCLAKVEPAWAYGEQINGFQTHYEIHNQYISEGFLVMEGFYYVYELQNFTSSSKESGTHYYFLELENSKGKKIYNDTENYYMDLTSLEFKAGQPWAGKEEGDVVDPNLTTSNYRYRDVGFQFRIPLSDLTDFTGEMASWNIKMTCVAKNTYLGRGIQMPFKQENIYCSRTFPDLKFDDYIVKPYSSFDTLSSKIYASIGYVRTGSGRQTNIVQYAGKNLYWSENEWFQDLSMSAAVSLPNEKVTWYGLRYGGIYLDGIRYRARYDPGGTYGWIPSVFLDSISGTPYVISIENTPPIINASDIELPEGTNIDEALIFQGVSAYDYSFGTILPTLQSTNLILNSSTNDVGKYYATFVAVDSNMAETKKTIQISIVNEKPEIYAGNKSMGIGRILTEEFLLENVTAYDAGDGDLTAHIKIHDTQGLIPGSIMNENGIYTITYSVMDKNGATGYEKGFLTIFSRYIRSISLENVDTLAEASKWNTRWMKANLLTILERDGVTDSYEQIWYFENEEKEQIREYVLRNGPSKETNRWILENYIKCRVK